MCKLRRSSWPRGLKAIGGQLGYDVAQDGRSITVTIQPGEAWKLRPAEGSDKSNQAEIVLYDCTSPEKTALPHFAW